MQHMKPEAGVAACSRRTVAFLFLGVVAVALAGEVHLGAQTPSAGAGTANAPANATAASKPASTRPDPNGPMTAAQGAAILRDSNPSGYCSKTAPHQVRVCGGLPSRNPLGCASNPAGTT